MARLRYCINCSKIVAYGPSCVSCVALSRPKSRKLYGTRKWKETWLNGLSPRDRMLMSYRLRRIGREEI